MRTHAHANRTHCKHGHALTPENTVIQWKKKKNGRPGRQSLRACIICHKAAQRRSYLARYAKPIPASEQQVRAVLVGLREGKSLRNLTSGSVGHTYVPGLLVVSAPKLRAFRLLHPRLNKIITKLAVVNAKAQWDAGQVRKWEGKRKSAISAVRSGDIFQEIRDAVPFGTFDREEVIASMALALVEGQLLRRDVAARVPEFIRAQGRMFSKFVPVVGGIMGSLDMPAYQDGATPLVETITRGLWQ